jgi:glucan endo-1,3-beta-D-glucosidase
LNHTVTIPFEQQDGSTSDPTEAITAALAADTTPLLGHSAYGDQTLFDDEIAALKSAVSKFGTTFTNLVVGISVGSENLCRISAARIATKSGFGAGPVMLVSCISHVRAAVKGTGLASVQIGHVDTVPAWANTSNSAVVSAVDWSYGSII